MIEYEYIIPFAIALIVSFFATPIAKKIAVSFNAIDVPKDDRRMHKRPVALMGGLAIITGFIVSILYAFFVYQPDILKSWLVEFPTAKIVGVLVSAIITIVMGPLMMCVLYCQS